RAVNTAQTTRRGFEFHLFVTFGDNGGTIQSESDQGVVGGRVHLTIAGTNIIYGIVFDGKFDENGVISGSANDGIYSIPGTFNGLIGANGAVGIFKGILANGTRGYVGGFQLAAPAVDCTATPFVAECENSPRRLMLNALCRSDGTNPFDAECASSNYPYLASQQLNYCSNRFNTWKTICDNAVDTGDVIRNARAKICLANGTIATGSEDPIAAAALRIPGTIFAGSSLFNTVCDNLTDGTTSVADARAQLITDCSTGGSKAGSADCNTLVGSSVITVADCIANPSLTDACESPLVTDCSTDGSKFDTPACNTVIDVSGTTVADCAANPFLTTDGCNTHVAFVVARGDRQSLCTTEATAFDALCANLLSDPENTDISAFSGALASARTDYCAAATGTTDVTNCESDYYIA
ncbi:MAG: hypothetical protein K8953_13910, partial [Proteobacteria bacterium]|nr:hypothetical protein [Pseudomonadota bacterium]